MARAGLGLGADPRVPACLHASMPARAPACVRPSGPTRINSSEGQQQGQQQVLPQ